MAVAASIILSRVRDQLVDSRAIQSRGQSADAREGVSSFLEKRTPVYPDKVSTDLPGFFPWWDEPDFK